MMCEKGCELLRLGEACRKLGVRYATAWAAVTSGGVPAVQLRGRWYVRAADLPLAAMALGVDPEVLP